MAAVVLSAVLTNHYNISFPSSSAANYQTFTCSTGTSGQPTLRILTLFINEQAQSITDQLCDHTALRKQFSSIEINWQIHAQLNLRSLYDQQYDLVFSRQNLLQQVSVEGVDNYQLIAQLPDYGSQLLARDKQPQLETTYFAGKTLGLLDNPFSASGYRIPKREILAAGIDVAQYQTRFFSSHQALHQALQQGEVDVIASFLVAELPLSLPNLYSLPLNERLPGPGLFIAPALLDTTKHCAIIAALQSLTEHIAQPLVSNTRILRPCRGNT